MSDELVIRPREGGGIIVEMPIGRALRVEALLVDHMARVHDLTPQEAVEALTVGQA